MTAVGTKKEERTTYPHGHDRFTYAGIFAVAIAAAVLSFSSLTGLARMAGVTGAWAGFRLAWLLPIAVDAYAVTATRVWLAGGSNPATVRYARANAIGAIGLSVAGNATFHALNASGIDSLGHVRAGWLGVVAVSAVPPVMLGLVGHLHALISTTHEPDAAGTKTGGPSSDTRGDTGSEERPTPASNPEPTDTATTDATTDPVPATATNTNKAKPATVRRSRSTGKTSTGTGASPRTGAEAAMRAHWATERAAGRTPTGAELDRVAGTKDYGRRIRRTLLAEDDASEVAAAAPSAEEPATAPDPTTDPADAASGSEQAAA